MRCRAVITGGARGIGAQMAIKLAEARARVVLADIDAEAATATVRRIRQLGGEVKVVACDVSDLADVQRLHDESVAWLGDVDLLVNNAGVLVTGELATLPLAEHRRVIDVNLWGVINGCHAFIPTMLARGRGRIINVASLAGAIPLPFMGAYSATKAAVLSYSETLHAELRRKGIVVTVLCPSFTDSHFLEGATGTASDGTMRLAHTLMKCIGSAPHDVADLALDASEHGRLYAIPTIHGRLAWWSKRISPSAVTHALGAAHAAAQRYYG